SKFNIPLDSFNMSIVLGSYKALVIQNMWFLQSLTSSLVYDYTKRLIVRHKKEKIFYSIAIYQ
ncbi:MAG TPA: hypothetical protein VE445_02360, partial [Nitrososphaeraceae archaeon]|nr:hypothetical protein [Nitrososphaeraceae archaeon]